MKKLLSAALLAAAFAAPAVATTYVRVSDEALVDGAPLIVVGKVEARNPAADGAAATEYRLRVEEVLKGEAPAQISVRVLGGGGGPVRLKVWGAPSFRPEGRVMLFLRPDGHGSYAVEHVFLGVFHELAAGERRLAVRDLSEVRQARVRIAGELELVAAEEPVRDFAAFRGWVADRSRGLARSADYLLSGQQASGLRSATGSFTLFEDEIDGLNIRWFVFDGNNPGNVRWRANSSGQAGLSGGGFSEFQTALEAWNDEPNTPIDQRYQGTTNVSESLGEDEFDGINALVFNDPNNVLPGSFSCALGGVVALGGVWYGTEDPRSFKGQLYWPAIGADIVTNNGLSCLFAGGNASKMAQQVFGHELGHAVGIGHSCGDSLSPSCNNPVFDEALMRATIHNDNRGAALNSDDRAAAQALYLQSSAQTPPAGPTDLSGNGTSTTEIALTWQDNASDETDYRVEMKQAGAATFQELVTPSGSPQLPANLESITVTGLAPATAYFFRVRAHNDAGFSAYSNEALVATNSNVVTCVADGDTLCLNDDRFQVELTWRTASDSGTGQAVPIPSAPDSGLFYFFHPSNLEMLIKALDGCPLNERFWVFFAATTNVEFMVTVTDTQTGKVKPYFNPLNTPAAPVQDTDAFATCP